MSALHDVVRPDGLEAIVGADDGLQAVWSHHIVQRTHLCSHRGTLSH